MVIINPATKTYWILFNSISNRYIAGATEPNQVTEASDDWSIYFSSLVEQEWLDQCDLLNIEE